MDQALHHDKIQNEVDTEVSLDDLKNVSGGTDSNGLSNGDLTEEQQAIIIGLAKKILQCEEEIPSADTLIPQMPESYKAIRYTALYCKAQQCCALQAAQQPPKPLCGFGRGRITERLAALCAARRQRRRIANRYSDLQ